ncbi:MAG: hypothetical protein LBL35_03150 [Clostridiales bacterium]|nr:hypothetical protein [Clostridiales bacterium]
MKLKDIIRYVEATVYVCDELAEEEIISACGADLMSDVLAFSKERVVLLTGLVNLQVIRTAEMMEIKAILFVRGKEPTREMKSLAEEKSILLMSTKYSMYFSCGILYQKGLGRL